MTLHVYSARIGIRDQDALDITRTGNDPLGIIFAPSDRLLWPTKDAMREADELERQAGDLFGSLGAQRPEAMLAQAEALRAATWAHYEPAYIEEMRVSYRKHRSDWDAVLARPRVVCCCYCVLKPGQPQRCHRALLRSIFAKLGAVDCGDL